MSDERGRKRDTPTGLGPAKPGSGHVPRGAGLSGNVPGGSRFARTEQGISPLGTKTPPQPDASDGPARYEPIASGPWDAATTPPRNVMEPHPARAAKPPRAANVPDPLARAAADAFAVTRPAERAPLPPSQLQPDERPAARELHDRLNARGGRSQGSEPQGSERFGSLRPRPDAAQSPDSPRGPERQGRSDGHRSPPPPPPPSPGASLRAGVNLTASARPAAPEPKQSLRLKLDADGYDAVPEGRVRVPKRRAPMLLGILVLLGAVVGGALLWIDAHGGVQNFATQLERVISGEAPQPIATQPPAASPDTAAPPAQQQTPLAAQTPLQQPTAAASNSPPPQQQPDQPVTPTEPQIATGELEPPVAQGNDAPPQQADAKPATGASEVEAEPKAPPPQAAAPKPKPKPKPAVRRPPVRREPVIRIEELPPPDPSGGPAALPPPDPPAPE